jgi:serpin B
MATTLATDVRLSMEHQARFARNLASAIYSNPEYAARNAAYSPLSIHAGLSLVAAGAGGATREQLVATLGSWEAGEQAKGLHAVADASVARGPRVAFASGVFVDASLALKPSFKKLAVRGYMAEVQSADFKTKVIIPCTLPCIASS